MERSLFISQSTYFDINALKEQPFRIHITSALNYHFYIYI